MEKNRIMEMNKRLEEEINNLDTETPNGSRGAFIGHQEGTSSYHVPH